MLRLTNSILLALAIFHCLSLVFSDNTLPVTQSSLKRAWTSTAQTNPFLEIQIPASSDVFKKLKISFVSENEVSINGHKFSLISMSIVPSLISVRIALNGSNTELDLAKKMRDLSSEKGGMNQHTSVLYIPFLPPTIFTLNSPQLSIDPLSHYTFLDQYPQVGFGAIPGQPPQA